jgi:flagellar biogenesis protein FliO
MLKKEPAVQREQKQYTVWPWATRWSRVFWVGCLLCLLLRGGTALAGSTVEQRLGPRTTEDSMQPSPSQERFLQHFISRSLGQEEAKDASPGVLRQQSAAAPSQHAPPSLTEPQMAETRLSSELTTAATQMVFALGGVLSCLLAGGYLLRRYFLKHASLGQREGLLRVLGRVNLTPKATVALLEVPGKLLVIGITSSTLTALGEVAATALEAPATSAASSSASFADTLDQETLTLPEQTHTADPLLHGPEAIQRMVSGLKRL